MGSCKRETNRSQFSLPIVLIVGVAMGLAEGVLWDNREAFAQVSAVSTEEVPEEMLQTEIVLEANSSWAGHPQNPSIYAQEQQALRPSVVEVSPRLDPSIQQVVGLLRLRKLLKSFLPFF